MKYLKVLKVVVGPRVIYPSLLYDAESMVLVDTGGPGDLSCVKAAADSQAVDLAKLTMIVITHHDFDHMGALAEFKRSYPHVKIASSAIDADYISGRKRSLRLEQAETLFDTLPDEEKPAALEFHKYLESIEPVEVDLTLNDGDHLDCCGGVEVISTPGHMPGHISLYAQTDKTIISGDALTTHEGKLMMANPQFTLDMPLALQSVKRLAPYDVKRVVAYPGGVFEGDFAAAVAQMLL